MKDSFPRALSAVSRIVDVGEALPGPSSCRSFLEGPAVDAAGDVYFSDEPCDRILRWEVQSQALREFRRPALRANGMAFDRTGRLVFCSGARPGGRRAVVRIEPDGAFNVLVGLYRDKPLNSPNDLVIDALGRIWFTDPRYGEGPPLEQGAEAVYRLDDPDPGPGRDPGDSLVRVLGLSDVKRPNGIALSPDGSTLYIADNDTRRGGRRQLVAFSIGPDGMPRDRRVIHDFGARTGADGIRVDVNGCIYAAAGDIDEGTAGIYLFDPTAASALAGVVPVPETPGNCTFGGPERRTLYITATRGLYRVEVNHPGHLVYPPPPKP